MKRSLILSLSLSLCLLITAGCGAVIVGGGAAALGTYAYVNGQSVGTFHTNVDTAMQASRAAFKDLSIPILKEKQDTSTGEIQGKLSKERVTVSIELVGGKLISIAVRVGLWGNEVTSRRILDTISGHL